jgi:hypothetical protein
LLLTWARCSQRWPEAKEWLNTFDVGRTTYKFIGAQSYSLKRKQIGNPGGCGGGWRFASNSAAVTCLPGLLPYPDTTRSFLSPFLIWQRGCCGLL